MASRKVQVNGDGPPEEISGVVQALLQELSEQKEAVRLERSKNNDSDMGTLCRDDAEVSLISPVMNMKCRKTLKGHRGKILHFDWSPDKYHVITAGQDGYAFIWNAFTGQKDAVIQTTAHWVFACAFAPSTTLVACGGLENQCSIYNLGNRLGADERTEEKALRISLPNKIVAQHSKYISNCAFCGSDQQLLTASADTTCALWDLEKKDPIMKFLGHKMEVLGLSLNPRDPYSMFASGSSDCSTCVWDVRTGRCMMKFTNQEYGINAVKFTPNGDTLAVGGTDGSIHLYDLRADQEMKLYSKPSILFGVSAVDFSKSGRILFAGYEDYSIRAWDVQKGTHLHLWLNHTDRVSNVLMSPDGTALGTSSWDGTLRIFA